MVVMDGWDQSKSLLCALCMLLSGDQEKRRSHVIGHFIENREIGGNDQQVLGRRDAGPVPAIAHHKTVTVHLHQRRVILICEPALNQAVVWSVSRAHKRDLDLGRGELKLREGHKSTPVCLRGI